MNCSMCLKAFDTNEELQSHLGEQHVRGDMALMNLNSTIYGAEVNVLITSTNPKNLEAMNWVVNAIYFYEDYLKKKAFKEEKSSFPSEAIPNQGTN